jgi:hypothetical protein
MDNTWDIGSAYERKRMRALLGSKSDRRLPLMAVEFQRAIDTVAKSLPPGAAPLAWSSFHLLLSELEDFPGKDHSLIGAVSTFGRDAPSFIVALTIEKASGRFSDWVSMHLFTTTAPTEATVYTDGTAAIDSWHPVGKGRLIRSFKPDDDVLVGLADFLVTHLAGLNVERDLLYA